MTPAYERHIEALELAEVHAKAKRYLPAAERMMAAVWYVDDDLMASQLHLQRASYLLKAGDYEKTVVAFEMAAETAEEAGAYLEQAHIYLQMAEFIATTSGYDFARDVLRDARAVLMHDKTSDSEAIEKARAQIEEALVSYTTVFARSTETWDQPTTDTGENTVRYFAPETYPGPAFGTLE